MNDSNKRRRKTCKKSISFFLKTKKNLFRINNKTKKFSKNGKNEKQKSYIPTGWYLNRTFRDNEENKRIPIKS